MSFETNATSDWMNMPGARLAEGIEVGKFIRAEENCALFSATVSGENGTDFVRVCRLEESAAAKQTELWRELARIRHPNLLAILHEGRSEAGEPVSYVVTQGAEESLAGVLSERSLTPDEAKEVLSALANALAALHAAGFVHGRIAPREIFATEDAIKLSTDCAKKAGERLIGMRDKPGYLAPEEQSENTSTAADIWCLGASLFEALTQSPFNMEQIDETRRLTKSVGEIIARCVRKEPSERPSIEEVLALTREPEEPEQIAEAASPTGWVRYAAEDVPPMTSYATEQRSRLPQILMVLGLAVGLVAFFMWWTRSTPPKEQASVASQPSGAAVTKDIGPGTDTEPAPVKTPATVKNDLPKETATATEPERKPDEPSGASVGEELHTPVRGTIWRLVLWTYNQKPDAQGKVDALMEKHPDMHAEVFSPKGDSGPYLVVAGGQMTRDEAEAMRKKARQIGMPRDCYVQNFNH